MASAAAVEANVNSDEGEKGIAGLSINPKDLTNEELEYVIKTGKVPPRCQPFEPAQP